MDRGAHTRRPGNLAGAGSQPGSGMEAIQHFGVGRKARVAAIRAADDLRARGTAAAALFRPSMGGWVVRVYPGGIRPRD